MSLWLINVGIILIALMNVDPLVFQFDSINFFKKGYIFMSQNNAMMKRIVQFLTLTAMYSYFMTVLCGMKM